MLSIWFFSFRWRMGYADLWVALWGDWSLLVSWYGDWNSFLFFGGLSYLYILVKKSWFLRPWHTNYSCLVDFFFFFFWESFNLWRPLLMITLYHQTKTPISFWYRQKLKFVSFLVWWLKLLFIFGNFYSGKKQKHLSCKFFF